MSKQEQLQQERSCNREAMWPVMICLLGNFRLLRAGQAIGMRAGGKSEGLLSYLALQNGRRLPRERLIEVLWPSSDLALGLNSLNNLVHSVHKILSPELQGNAPILHEDGYYRLNAEAGIGVDVACFDGLVDTGNRQMQAGVSSDALESYRRALDLYRDDLCVASDPQTVMERERLRARHLTILAQLADYYYAADDHTTCLEYVWSLLTRDPCREDAHRLVMQCYVRRGERAAALRQFQLCAELLRTEFNAAPEPATVALFDQIRLQPT